MPNKPVLASVVVGTSVENRPILAWNLGDPSDAILLFGGIHGDEPASTFVAERLLDTLRAAPTSTKSGVIIIPAANPDGLARKTRENARGVDLNRNFPAANWRRAPRNRHGPKPASEPETQALIALIERYRPRLVVSIHCIHGPRECNNYDGPARPQAELMSRHNGYRATPTIGYPTPGSFGSWAGVDLKIPVITLELPRRAKPAACWEQNRAALLALLQPAAD